MSTYTRITNF